MKEKIKFINGWMATKDNGDYNVGDGILLYRDNNKIYRRVIRNLACNFYFFIDKKNKELRYKTEESGDYLKLFIPKYNKKDINFIKCIEYLDDNKIKHYEADLTALRRYCIDNDIEVEDFDKMKQLYFDIETTTVENIKDFEKQKILSFAAVDQDGKEYFLIGDTEKELLLKINDLIKKYDILIGWNSGGYFKYGEAQGFDIPCLLFRFKKYKIPTSHLYHVLKEDLMYRIKSSYSLKSDVRESLVNFSLDYIARYFLNKGKIDIGDIKPEKLYRRNINLFKEYNLNDARLVYELEKKTGVIGLTMKLNQWCGVLGQPYSPLSSLDNFILKEGNKRGIHFETNKKYIFNGLFEGDDSKIMGGFVMDPKEGLYDNVNVLDFKCFDKDTEILTKDGWKVGLGLNKKDEILTWNSKTNSLEYQKPIKKYVYKYSGELIKVQNKNLDMLVTPNHRVLYQEKNGQWKVCEAKDLKNNINIPIAGNFSGFENKFKDDEIKLFGWIIAKGHLYKDKTISICVSELKFAKEIRRILKKLNISFIEDFQIARSKKLKEYSFYIFYINKTQSKKFYSELKGKKQLTETLLNLDKRQLKILFETIMNGDGLWKEVNKDGYYCSINKNLIDRFQELAIKLNWGTSLKYGAKNVIHLFKKPYSKIYSLNIKKEKYNGYVWCVETKNTFVVVRRNGYVFISGNSLYPSIMISFNISPDTLIDSESNEKNVIKTPCGSKFTKKFIGVVPEKIKELLEMRDKFKKRMKEVNENSPEYLELDAKQWVTKTISNSFYGIFGQKVSRYFKKEIAEAITLTGQYIIKKTIDYIKNNNMKVISSDTDSIFIVLENKNIDISNICKNIDDYINKDIEKKFGVENSCLTIKPDKSYDKIIVVSKKRYAGIKDGKISITGLECVRRDVVGIAKNLQKELLEKILSGESKENILEWFKKERNNVLGKKEYNPEDIYIKIYLQKDLDSYGPKKDLNRKYTAPIHVRIAQKSNKKIIAGQYLYYVITNDKPLDGVLSEDFDGNWCRSYYWSNRIAPVLYRVIIAAFPNLKIDKSLLC